MVGARSSTPTTATWTWSSDNDDCSDAVVQHVDSLPPDVRTRYNSKKACIKCDPYCIPSTEWEKDVSKWPLIGFLDVGDVYSPSAYTSEQLKKYKSLEAYKFYQDGWIRQILHKKIGELHLVLAKVITALLNVSESFRLGLWQASSMTPNPYAMPMAMVWLCM